ncbi:MAG: GRAM domain-containing protein [Bacteroidales bacterium]
MENYNSQQKTAFAIFAIAGAVIFGILMTLINGGFTYENLKSVLFPTIFFGLFMGLILPFMLKRSIPFLEKKVKTPQLHENETIILEGKANLFRNWLIASGGKLFLTNKRLIFNAHKYNFQKGETSIELEQISSIQKRKTAQLVDNGLRIKTTRNTEFNFVVDQRSEWIDRLAKR